MALVEAQIRVAEEKGIKDEKLIDAIERARGIVRLFQKNRAGNIIVRWKNRLYTIKLQRAVEGRNLKDIADIVRRAEERAPDIGSIRVARDSMDIIEEEIKLRAALEEATNRRDLLQLRTHLEHYAVASQAQPRSTWAGFRALTVKVDPEILRSANQMLAVLQGTEEMRRELEGAMEARDAYRFNEAMRVIKEGNLELDKGLIERATKLFQHLADEETTIHNLEFAVGMVMQKQIQGAAREDMNNIAELLNEVVAEYDAQIARSILAELQKRFKAEDALASALAPIDGEEPLLHARRLEQALAVVDHNCSQSLVDEATSMLTRVQSQARVLTELRDAMQSFDADLVVTLLREAEQLQINELFLAMARRVGLKSTLQDSLERARDTRDEDQLRICLEEWANATFSLKDSQYIKAKALYEVVVAENKALRRLDQAIEGRELQELRAAIEAASSVNVEKAGERGIAKLQGARDLLEALERGMECDRLAEAAVVSDSVDQLAAVVSRAESLKWTSTQVTQAKNRLVVLKRIQQSRTGLRAAREEAVSKRVAEGLRAVLDGEMGTKLLGAADEDIIEAERTYARVVDEIQVLEAAALAMSSRNLNQLRQSAREIARLGLDIAQSKQCLELLARVELEIAAWENVRQSMGAGRDEVDVEAKISSLRDALHVAQELDIARNQPASTEVLKTAEGVLQYWTKVVAQLKALRDAISKQSTMELSVAIEGARAIGMVVFDEYVETLKRFERHDDIRNELHQAVEAYNGQRIAQGLAAAEAEYVEDIDGVISRSRAALVEIKEKRAAAFEKLKGAVDKGGIREIESALGDYEALGEPDPTLLARARDTLEKRKSQYQALEACQVAIQNGSVLALQEALADAARHGCETFPIAEQAAKVFAATTALLHAVGTEGVVAAADQAIAAGAKMDTLTLQNANTEAIFFRAIVAGDHKTAVRAVRQCVAANLVDLAESWLKRVDAAHIPKCLRSKSLVNWFGLRGDPAREQSGLEFSKFGGFRDEKDFTEIGLFSFGKKIDPHTQKSWSAAINKSVTKYVSIADPERQRRESLSVTVVQVKPEPAYIKSSQEVFEQVRIACGEGKSKDEAARAAAIKVILENGDKPANQTNLRDEIYCQVTKQLINNPDPASVKHAWLLYCFVASSFAPSQSLAEHLIPFVAAELRKHASPQIEFVLAHLHIYASAPRPKSFLVPVPEAIDSLAVAVVSIFLPDGSEFKIGLWDHETAKSLSLRLGRWCSLPPDAALDIYVQRSENPHDLRGVGGHEVVYLVLERSPENSKLVARLTLIEAMGDQFVFDDSQYAKIAYGQTLDGVLNGHIKPDSESEALDLVSAALLVEYGNASPETEAAVILSRRIDQLIPAWVRARHTLPSCAWADQIIPRWESLPQTESLVQAQKLFLKQASPYFGYGVFYNVVTLYRNDQPYEGVVGYSARKMWVLRRGEQDELHLEKEVEIDVCRASLKRGETSYIFDLGDLIVELHNITIAWLLKVK
eukprot:c17795_g1_i2.p1 GENE.c17795_g1_i2~~c17795_g1_i2.p1  ORF type:complete len:1609 (+),score=459.10 c17795_g1_i2:342-4829(+)